MEFVQDIVSHPKKWALKTRQCANYTATKRLNPCSGKLNSDFAEDANLTSITKQKKIKQTSQIRKMIFRQRGIKVNVKSQDLALISDSKTIQFLSSVCGDERHKPGELRKAKPQSVRNRCLNTRYSRIEQPSLSYKDVVWPRISI